MSDDLHLHSFSYYCSIKKYFLNCCIEYCKSYKAMQTSPWSCKTKQEVCIPMADYNTTVRVSHIACMSWYTGILDTSMHYSQHESVILFSNCWPVVRPDTCPPTTVPMYVMHVPSPLKYRLPTGLAASLYTASVTPGATLLNMPQ